LANSIPTTKVITSLQVKPTTIVVNSIATKPSFPAPVAGQPIGAEVVTDSSLATFIRFL